MKNRNSSTKRTLNASRHLKMAWPVSQRCLTCRIVTFYSARLIQCELRRCTKSIRRAYRM